MNPFPATNIIIIFAIHCLLAFGCCIQEIQGLAASPSATNGGTSSKSTVVVYGPKSRELLLLVSKLAAKQPGRTASCICAPGTEDGCRRLMYGVDYANEGVDQPGKAKPISNPEEMDDALQRADSVVLVATDEPVDGATLTTFLKYTNTKVLKKIVLLSKMGVTNNKNGGGFFGGGNRAWKESEKALQKIASDHHLDFSIVRAGVLKGGGPSVDNVGNSLHEESSLSKAYYNTILDVVEYKVTVAHDTFSLGADSTSVVAGDPHTMPNIMTQIGTKASFEPGLTDTNRCTAASAVVASLSLPPLEISVGTAVGNELPTQEEWSTLLESILEINKNVVS